MFSRHAFFLMYLTTFFCSVANCQEGDSLFNSHLDTSKKPWTTKPFYNNPDNFQFAIVSDRTGGHRKGVFGKGLDKINQLYPEFVMSVGDLIEGYTKDTTLLNEQWDEFHGILDTLQTKFFYVAGNHDYSNDTMAQQWKERYGKDYYHFIYKNVLFLIVNTNDGDGVMMGKDQINFLKEAIAKNTKVRWTMIFMHHPIWSYGELNGFNEVEASLKGRDYTVFAGHTHRYLFDVRKDQNHYVLATTGGGSKLRGSRFGEFDHVGWVTMTDNGPKLVNLELSGIIDHDVINPSRSDLAQGIIKATDFKTLILEKDNERKVVMLLENTTDRTLHFKGRLYHHHQVKAENANIETEIPPMATKQLIMHTAPITDLSPKFWDPLELQWEIGIDKEMNLSGTEIINLDASLPNLNLTEQNIFLKDLKIGIDHPYQDLKIKYTLDNTEPGINTPVFSDSLNLDKTQILQLSMMDHEGFKSGVLSTSYQKVTPMPALKKFKNLKKGLEYTYYEGDFDSVPDFTQLQPLKKGTAIELDPDKIGQRLDHYAIQYQGFIEVPKTGIYTFYLSSDDGSKLYLNNNLVIDNDGSHDVAVKKGMMALKKGMHPVRIDYFEDFLGEALEIQYSGPGMARAPVNFWH